ncbi:hypothetical protein Scep_011633 [Stephania cephalantha]|uniref:Uncharacterized protein n=1 Tax=Stephania cephalantha TaxID=152367 RepID=A0AAP0JFN7_9MAGN
MSPGARSSLGGGISTRSYGRFLDSFDGTKRSFGRSLDHLDPPKDHRGKSAPPRFEPTPRGIRRRLMEPCTIELLWLNGTRLHEPTPLSREGVGSNRGGCGISLGWSFGRIEVELGSRRVLRAGRVPNIKVLLFVTAKPLPDGRSRAVRRSYPKRPWDLVDIPLPDSTRPLGHKYARFNDRVPRELVRLGGTRLLKRAYLCPWARVRVWGGGISTRSYGRFSDSFDGTKRSYGRSLGRYETI